MAEPGMLDYLRQQVADLEQMVTEKMADEDGLDEGAVCTGPPTPSAGVGPCEDGEQRGGEDTHNDTSLHAPPEGRVHEEKPITTILSNRSKRCRQFMVSSQHLSSLVESNTLCQTCTWAVSTVVDQARAHSERLLSKAKKLKIPSSPPPQPLAKGFVANFPSANRAHVTSARSLLPPERRGNSPTGRNATTRRDSEETSRPASVCYSLEGDPDPQQYPYAHIWESEMVDMEDILEVIYICFHLDTSICVYICIHLDVYIYIYIYVHTHVNI